MLKKQKILIVRLSAIGDVIHSLPILHSLKTSNPDAFIGWVVEDKAADIIINNPLIDRVHVMPKKLWKKRGMSLKNVIEFIKFIKEIKDEKYTIAIDLQELFKSGVISFLSGAKRRIAHSGAREFADIFANEKLPYHDNFDINKPIIERYLEPATYLGAKTNEVRFFLPPTKEETVIYVDELLKNIDKNKKNIVFSPATIWPSKHWKEKYWSELLDMTADKYNIIFTGSTNDIALINRIKSNATKDNSFVIAGKTNIEQLIEVFNRTDIVIAPDTGPAHIANAVEKPVIICIFGSTSFKRSGPYGNKHFSLSAKLDCQPCFKRLCPRKTNKMECVNKITPEEVFNI
ncbi:MAG: glycosyltransferase family 9 protein, partial [Candidatus Gastranaerophilaceae bacterium]